MKEFKARFFLKKNQCRLQGSSGGPPRLVYYGNSVPLAVEEVPEHIII